MLTRCKNTILHEEHKRRFVFSYDSVIAKPFLCVHSLGGSSVWQIKINIINHVVITLSFGVQNLTWLATWQSLTVTHTYRHTWIAAWRYRPRARDVIIIQPVPAVLLMSSKRLLILSMSWLIILCIIWRLCCQIVSKSINLDDERRAERWDDIMYCCCCCSLCPVAASHTIQVLRQSRLF